MRVFQPGPGGRRGPDPAGARRTPRTRRRARLRHEHKRLPVKPGELHDGTGEISSGEIEGHDMILAYAIQATIRSESQSPRPAESDRALGREDAHELPGGRVVLAHARHGVSGAER